MAYQTSSRNRSSGLVTTPRGTMPMPATMAVMGARRRAVVARAPANLPLMTSSRQIGCESRRGSVRSVRSLLMASKPKAMPSSGPRKATKSTSGGGVPEPTGNSFRERAGGAPGGGGAGADGKQVQEGAGRAAGGRGDVADAARGGVDGAHRGQAEAEREQEEADAVEVVGELLGGDDAPAASLGIGVGGGRGGGPRAAR